MVFNQLKSWHGIVPEITRGNQAKYPTLISCTMYRLAISNKIAQKTQFLYIYLFLMKPLKKILFHFMRFITVFLIYIVIN
jgi:hypothetical protein